ncbi:IS5 family transposase [Sphingomonas aestuarii]
MDGAVGGAVALAVGRRWQVEQRVPALPALGRDRRVRCVAGDAGRNGGARHQRRHDRQHGGSGASLRRRAKKGDQETQGLGRSRGGFTTKLHARCDGHGRPLCFVLTPGQTRDVHGFGPLFRMLGDRIEALLADKGYDADAIRAELATADVEAVIPAKSNRRILISYDRAKYRWRNLVERLFSKLKNWRRIATRYDKTKESYLGFVALASIKLWIPFVHDA